MSSPRLYRYSVAGTAADGQTWEVSGELDVPPGEPGTVFTKFSGACRDAIREAFIKLTSGRAIYGFAGVGCSGPYTIVKLTIERADLISPPDETG